MTTWFTSDTHFGHKNIIKFCDRPFKDVSHMNEILINNWNSVVHPEDTVYHLGDVALGPWEAWNGVLSRLNGTKHLVIGNHERIFKGNKQRMVERFRPVYQQWFDTITSRRNLTLTNAEAVNLSHFPYTGDSHGQDRYAENRLADYGVPLIHGHTHEDQIVSRTTMGTLQIHVGVDAWDYYPVSEEQIITILENTPRW